MGAKRIVRIAGFSLVFFLLGIFIYNLIVPAFKNGNLIALFFLRKDNITNTLRGEIYPIAYYSKGKYLDASVDVTDSAENVHGDKTILNKIKDFIILGESGKIGNFRVDEISASSYRCSEILTGKGDNKNNTALTIISDGISNERYSRTKGFQDGEDIDYSFVWTLAASRIFKEPKVLNIPNNTVESYKSAITAMAVKLLSNYSSDDAIHRGVVFKNINFFDLDRDGKPEVTAKFLREIRKKIKVITWKGEEIEDFSNDTVYLNLWVTYKSGNPQIILSLISEEREGSWGSGYDLVGTLDINGDSIDEVILRSSGWEVVDFEIYEYRNDKLERVFQGAAFGC